MTSRQLDLRMLESDSLQKSYCTISGLGYGSFGFAILAKSKKTVDKFFQNSKERKGTMLEPVARRHPSSLYANRLVAIKIMKTQFAKPADYLRVNEVKFILSVPSHENLLQIFSVFVDKLNGRLNIVMEPMDQNLYQFIQRNQDRPLAKATIKSILAQLLNAIKHIHSYGFFHRDVKPENILVSLASNYYGGSLEIPPDREGDLFIIKLCDYGLARHYSNSKELTPYVSTRWYRAPEILLRLHYYSFPIDVWAFGCVAVELANMFPLFTGKNESEQLWEILKVLGHPLNHKKNDIGGKWSEGVHLADNLGFLLPFTLSTSIRDVLSDPRHRELGDTIKGCFMWDPELRPNVYELSKADYFKGSVLTQEPVREVTSSTQEQLHERSGSAQVTHSSLDDDEYDYYPIGFHNSQSEIASVTPSASRDVTSNQISTQEAYSDPIMSAMAEEFSPNSRNDGEAFETSLYEKYTMLGDGLSPGSPSFTGRQSANVFESEALEEIALQNTSFGSHEISC